LFHKNRAKFADNRPIFGLQIHRDAFSAGATEYGSSTPLGALTTLPRSMDLRGRFANRKGAKGKRKGREGKRKKGRKG